MSPAKTTDDEFRALLEAAPDAIVIVDERGRIQLVNAQAEQLFGYARSAMVGQSIEMLVPEATRAAHAGYRRRYLEKPGTRPMGAGVELHARRSDGTEFPAEISLSPLITDTGILTISAIRDVSGRKGAEAKFRALLESAPDAMVIVNAAGEIVLINAQTERMFGYARSELLGRPVEMLVPSKYRQVHAGHRKDYTAAAQPRPMGAALELFAVRRDGREFPVEISLSPLATNEGTLVASAIRDITDRKLAEQERARLLQERGIHAEANRVKDEFLAILSHELRTPLNAILGWIHLIRNSALDERAVQKAIATIERNALAQARLIEDLLDVSRIVSGNLRLQVTATDFCQVIENAVDVVRPTAEAKSVSLDVRFETRPMPVMGDPDRLQQAVWNLLSNAVKYSRESSRVEVRVWTEDRTIRLSVSDAGCGIDPAFLPHVFDRFRQADSSYARAASGLGLGLAIVRSITELHGGRVEAASAGEGLGATFSLTVPGVGAAAGRSTEAPSAGHHVERLDGVRVLVVDDHADERELLYMILSSYGADVETAESAEVALAIIQRGSPTVLVTDLAMPKVDGYELLQRVRALPEPHRNVPTIAVTAHARAEDRTRALNAGFQGYISKPIDLGQLVRAVKELSARGSGSTVPTSVELQ